MTQKTGLLLLLGLMWSVRLSAIKAAGLAGIPIYVVIAVAALGGAVFFSFRALLTCDWPPNDRKVLAFYGLSGVLGFLAPVALETAVAPRLPVFLFVVIIATVPLFTLILSILGGAERLRTVPTFAVLLGFGGGYCNRPRHRWGPPAWTVRPIMGCRCIRSAITLRAQYRVRGHTLAVESGAYACRPRTGAYRGGCCSAWQCGSGRH